MKRAIFMLLLFVSVNCFGKGFVDGEKITDIVVQDANGVGAARVCIYVDQAVSNRPSCATKDRFCADITNDVGKSTLSMALYAKSTNSDVKILGTDTCNDVTNSEDIDYILVVGD